MSAILIWAMEHGYIDAALVSYLEGDGTSWKAIPGVARTNEEILAAAGSRYTYCPNTMAYADAIATGAEKIGLVGMSWPTQVPPDRRHVGTPPGTRALNPRIPIRSNEARRAPRGRKCRRRCRTVLAAQRVTNREASRSGVLQR